MGLMTENKRHERYTKLKGHLSKSQAKRCSSQISKYTYAELEAYMARLRNTEG